jgi:hypothetical protein
VKAPPSKAFRHDVMVPDSIASLPMLTIVARQSGEACKRPFVAVYEPSTVSQPASVNSIRSFSPVTSNSNFVGLEIESRSDSREFIFSMSGDNKEVIHQGSSFRGTYAVISEKDGAIKYLFLGKGRSVSKDGYGLIANTDSASAVLLQDEKDLYFTSSQPVTLTIPMEVIPSAKLRVVINNKPLTISGKKGTLGGKPVLSFNMPAAPYHKLDLH